MKRIVVLAVISASGLAHAREAHVTAVTPTTIYIDAGTSDGLELGAKWQPTVNGRTIDVRVAGIASHGAELEVEGPRPAVGAALALPAGLTPPALVTPRPPPAPPPPWRGVPAALGAVQQVAAREQPAPAAPSDETTVSGELALSAFWAADTRNTSTSWQDLSLSSQLAIESGAWRYDHIVDAHVVATPEVATAPLQHAQARFDIFLMRLAYAPSGSRYAAAIGRQPAAPMGELGTVDGGKVNVAIDRSFDVTAFAGLRPASDLGISPAPRLGADLGWQLATAGGIRARADAGVAIDEYVGRLDRALAAVSASLQTAHELIHTDATADLATDASGEGARLSRVNVFARTQRGAITASAELGYDRPFWDRALAAEAPDLLLGPRSFAQADATYALGSTLDLGSSARVAYGDGFTSTYGELTGVWHPPSRLWLVTAAPYAVVGSLVDEYGGRASLNCPFYAWSLGLGGSLERVYAAGEQAWAEIGHLSGTRAFYDHWRTALSLEVAAGDGPPRVLAFALLAYRFGK